MGKIIDYLNDLHDECNIGNVSMAFTKDNLSKTVCGKPVNRIATVRHQTIDKSNGKFKTTF